MPALTCARAADVLLSWLSVAADDFRVRPDTLAGATENYRPICSAFVRPEVDLSTFNSDDKQTSESPLSFV